MRWATLVILALVVVACARLLAPPPTPPPKRPLASHKEAKRQILSAERPCLTQDQAQRAERALFVIHTPREPEKWMGAINNALYDQHADCADEDFLALLLATIQLESGVNVDPPLADPNLEALFVRKLEQLREDNLFAAELISLSDLDASVRAKLRADTRRGRVGTEGALVRYVEKDLRPWLQAHLHEHYLVPESLGQMAAERWLPSPVSTLGPMQVNAAKAFRDAKARGEPIGSVEEMRELLLDPRTALDRGLREGVALLLPVYRYYRARLPADEAVLYAGADYNAGEYSARNAAYQEMVSKLTKRPLVLDGDLLAYRDEAPVKELSQTEAGISRVLPTFTPAAIRRDLLREKEAAFSESPVARAICVEYRRALGGECPVARIPQGAENPGAGIKLGRPYSPANYARAIRDRYRRNKGLLEEPPILEESAIP